MSTERTLHCKMCDATPDNYETTSRFILSSVYKMRKPIAELVELELETAGVIEITLMGAGHVDDLWDFLREHKGHDMDLKDEYGRFEPLE